MCVCIGIYIYTYILLIVQCTEIHVNNIVMLTINSDVRTQPTNSVVSVVD